MMKRLLCLLAALLMVVLALGSTALADEPLYRSYAYTPDGKPFYMQTPYMPHSIVGQKLYDVPSGNGTRTPIGGLNNPMDMCLTADGSMYIADRGNNRIVKMNLDGVLLAEYGVGTLKAPEGVDVDANGVLYVADTGNSRVVVFEPNGEIRAIHNKPDDVRVQDVMFTPTRVMVDDRGYLYTLLKGSNEGLMILSGEGHFQGFFGRNATQMDLGERLKRFFYTEEQIATNQNAVASSITGMCVSVNGYIYTCTSTLAGGQIKKFNANGDNLFNDVVTQVVIDRHNDVKSAVSALYVDGDGTIFAVDSTNGTVIVYDANGKPLMMFGEKLTGNDRRIGYFSDPQAIGTMPDGTLVVLDRAYNGLHVFKPTTLTGTILNAVALYNDGRYTQAETQWNEILKANSSYYWANLGLGRVAYMNGDWTKSMEYMKLAENQEYYSDAMWKMRAAGVQKNASMVIVVLIALWAVNLIIRKVTGKGMFGWLKKLGQLLHKLIVRPIYNRFPGFEHLIYELRFSTGMLRHPVDTLYDATRRTSGSLVSAAVLYIVFVAVMVLEHGVTNFIFDMEGMRGVSLPSALLMYVAPVVLWIAGNYLVGAITKGQGTLRGIIIGTVYALMPMILFTLPIALLSNVLTLSEGTIYWILKLVIYGWTLLLLFTQVKEIHGYEFGETVKNILWILFVAAMIVVAVLTIIGILIQGYNFLNEFSREVFGYV